MSMSAVLILGKIICSCLVYILLVGVTQHHILMTMKYHGTEQLVYQRLSMFS